MMDRTATAATRLDHSNKAWTFYSSELKSSNEGVVVVMIVPNSGRTVGLRKCELRLAFCGAIPRF